MVIYIKTILFSLVVWQFVESAPQPCTELKYQEIECHETEYKSYRDCIHRQRENRMKRQLLIEKSPCKIFVRSIPRRDLLEFVSQMEGTVDKPSTLATNDYDEDVRQTEQEMNQEVVTNLNENQEAAEIEDDIEPTELVLVEGEGDIDLEVSSPTVNEDDYDEDTTEELDGQTNKIEESLEVISDAPVFITQSPHDRTIEPVSPSESTLNEYKDMTKSVTKSFTKLNEIPATTLDSIPQQTTAHPVNPTTQNSLQTTTSAISENSENEIIEIDLNSDFDWAIKKLMNKSIVIQGEIENKTYEYIIPHNVTTIIKLTNIINAPTIINATNINNIHILEEEEEEAPKENDEGEFGLGKDENGSCCIAVKPKSCHASSNGYKCQHGRFKTCGKQCTSRIIHVQRRKKCTKQECKHKIAYVPQPERQKCHYIDQWPFVACSRNERSNGKYSSCEGCYDHYGYGFHNYYGQTPPKCFGCYDDGFENGPLYRKGPYFWPPFYHQPPCYMMGTCGVYPQYFGGHFGNEMVDPAWGNSEYEPEMNEDNTFYVDENLDENSNGTEQNWGKPLQKCAIVSENDTVSIQNCETNFDNPYMAAPSSYPYYTSMNYMRPSRRRYRRRHRPAHRQSKRLNNQALTQTAKEKRHRIFIEEEPGDY